MLLLHSYRYSEQFFMTLERYAVNEMQPKLQTLGSCQSLHCGFEYQIDFIYFHIFLFIYKYLVVIYCVPVTFVAAKDVSVN